MTVILKSQIALASKVFNCSGFSVQLVLVLLTIRAETRLVEFVAVHCGDLFTVYFDVDVGSVASDFDRIPLPRFLARILRCGGQVVDRAQLVFTGRRAAHDLDFEAGVNWVFGILDTEEDAGIASRILPADVAFQHEVVK